MMMSSGNNYILLLSLSLHNGTFRCWAQIGHRERWKYNLCARAIIRFYIVYRPYYYLVLFGHFNRRK